MTYDSQTPAVRQTDSWSCSVAAAAWLLHSIGYHHDYHDLERLEVQAGLVSEADGLEVGSGGPLADWLGATFGVTTGHQFPVAWEWLQAHAGTMPCAIGSGSLYHWVAVRGVDGEGNLTLSNPAPGYRGLGDTMIEAQFTAWAPWACVYIEVEEAEDVGRIAELEQQVADDASLIGLMQGDWANAAEAAIRDARAEPNKTKRNAALDAALAALATIRNGG